LRAFLMAQPRVIGDTPLAAAAERALDKFLAAMPVALRARAAFLRQRLFIDTTGWRGVAENLQFLPVVQDAVSRDRKLAIDYRKPDGQIANRTIDPLGIVAKGMSWYLVANTPAGFRTFRVSRIEKATVLEIAVERPPDFDLATHWKTSAEKFRVSRLRYTVTARVDREMAGHFVSWRGAKELSRDADGRVTLRIDFDDIEHAAFAMLGMGVRVEVLEPDELREKILERAKGVVGRAGSGSTAI
jgi:predicted DNA-binding transcriptional regulator YafY